MYELTCPTCGQKATLSFVRIGAAVQCRPCGGRYHVLVAHVQRRVTLPAVEGEGPGPLVLGPPIVRAAPTRTSGVHRSPNLQVQSSPPSPAAAAPSNIGPATPPPPTRTPPPPTRAPAPPAAAPPATPVDDLDPQLPPALPPPSISAVAQMIARRKRQRRRAVAVRYLSVITVVLLVLVIIGYLMNVNMGGSRSASEDGTPTQATVPVPRNTSLDGSSLEPVVSSRKIEPANWVSIDRAPQYDGQETDTIRLEQQAYDNRGPQVVLFTARVVCSSFDIIEEAVLMLELINRDGRAFSQTSVPLLLLNGSQMTQISVPISRANYDRTERIGWEVQVVRKLTGGVMFDRVMPEPVGSPDRMALRMTAFNPLPSELKRAVFVIQATDARGELVGRWRAEWTQTIAPRQRVELVAATPMHGAAVGLNFQVIAAGEPAVVPPPSTPAEPAPEALP
jgi:hypothetical protein